MRFPFGSRYGTPWMRCGRQQIEKYSRRSRRRLRHKPSVELLEDRVVPTVIASNDVHVHIEDLTTVNSLINVADAGTVADVNVTLDITHSRDKDLTVYVQGPDGTRVELFTEIGGGGDNFTNTTLDDEASTSITSGTAPFTGSFRPVGSLAAFDGKTADGTWLLEITDGQNNFNGILHSWSLTIETVEPSLSIADVQLAEGDSGSTAFVFTVTRSGDLTGVSTVDFVTADGTAIAGTSPGQGDYDPAGGQLMFDSGEVGKTITVIVNGDATSEPNETFFVNLSNSAGASIEDGSAQASILDDDAVSAPLPSGLVSWWTADNTSADLNGRNDAELVSGAVYVQGRVGQAFLFDGVDDRVQVPDSDSLKLTESMTIEAWLRIDSLPSATHGQILFRGDDRGALDPYHLSVERNGNLRFHIESLQEAVNLETPVPLGKLIHVAATLDHATDVMRIYIDGELAAETVTSVRPFADLDPAQNPSIGIGNHGGYPDSTHNQPFHGLVDELSIYRRALTAEEVRAIRDAYDKGKNRMAVVATSPDFGEVVTTPPATFVVDFTFPYLPSSLEAADLQVNGIAASSVSLTDSDTATFSFASSPVTSEGPQSMHMAAGVVTRASDGLELGSFDGTFFYDTLAMQVTGTTPSPGNDLALNSFGSVTTAVASVAGMNGQNAGWAVLYGSDAVSSGKLDLAVDEDTLLDSERTHIAEQIAVVAFDGNSSGNAAPYLRTGTVSGVGNSWTTVTLDRTYASMVVVATPSYTDASPPVVTRVRNASGDSFEVMVQRVDGQTGPVTGVEVHYTVVEEGVYTTAAHGVNMEAVKFVSTTTDRGGNDHSNLVGEDQSANVSNTYAKPVVIGQVMTANDPAFSVFWARGGIAQTAPSSSSIYVGKHIGEDPNTTRADETIGYIVIDSGIGTIGGTNYFAGLSDEIVQGMDNGPPFDYYLNFAKLQVDFNEPYDQNNLGVDGLTLNSGIVTRAEGADADTVNYTMVGVQPNATLTVDMKSTALTDQFGNPMLPFSASYNAILPVLSINDVSVSEGNTGEQNTATFTVTRSGDTSGTVTVEYATADDTASASSDYIGIGATVLTFSPGETSKTVEVTVLGDVADESDETFFVNLSNATNGAVIGDGQGVGTIVDDDGTATIDTLSDSPDPVKQGGDLTLTASVTGTPDSVSFYRDDGDGSFDSGADQLLGIDNDGSDGWSITVAIPSNFQTGTYTYFAQGAFGSQVTNVASTTGEVTKKKGGKPNLLADSVGNNAGTESITIEHVQPLLDEAINRFAITGEDVSGLSTINILIADLPGAMLGMAAGNTIWLDSDAAGHGYFIDPTPWDDSEFTTPGDQGEQGYIDALTVIAHELGHILGYEHDDNVMAETLEVGERRLPGHSHPWEAMLYALATEDEQ